MRGRWRISKAGNGYLGPPTQLTLHSEEAIEVY